MSTKIKFWKEKGYLQALGSSFEAVPDKGSLLCFINTFFGPIVLWRIANIKAIHKYDSRLK